jgi:hypothetical protein
MGTKSGIEEALGGEHGFAMLSTVSDVVYQGMLVEHHGMHVG